MAWRGPDPDMAQRLRQRAGQRRFQDLDPACDHGLTLATCTICNGRDRREAGQTARSAAPRLITARFDGQCRACDLPIVIGQRISWSPGSKPVHEECAR